MTRKRRAIIAITVSVVVLIAVGLISGLVASNKTNPTADNSIQKIMEQSFQDASYFSDVEVRAMVEDDQNVETVTETQVLLTVEQFTSEDFADFVKRIPETDITAYYGVSTSDGDLHMVGFSDDSLKNDVVVENVKKALTVKETESLDYMSISLGDVSITDLENITVTFVSPENTVETTRNLTEQLASEEVDVVAVNAYTPDQSSYIQTVVENNNFDNFDQLVGFGVQFGNEIMTEGTEISVLGFTGTTDVSVGYFTLPENMTAEQVQELADEINTTNEYGLSVVVEEPVEQ